MKRINSSTIGMAGSNSTASALPGRLKGNLAVRSHAGGNSMASKSWKNVHIESLMYRARKNWAAGKLVSATDFQFVERAWISFHLDKPLSHDDVRRLEALTMQLEGNTGQID